MSEVATITLNWSRKFQRDFPKWEINELHNEAFLISIQLLERGRYKKEKSGLSTFLWHALRFDVGHRYKRANAQRYLTCSDGVRRYQQKEISASKLTDAQKYEYENKNATIDEPPIVIIDAKVTNDWMNARINGVSPKQLQLRGMPYSEQKQQAENLRSIYDKQQSKRSKR